MLRAVIQLAEVTLWAAWVTFAARLARRKDSPDFFGWWRAEGKWLFLFLWLVFAVSGSLPYVIMWFKKNG